MYVFYIVHAFFANTQSLTVVFINKALNYKSFTNCIGFIFYLCLITHLNMEKVEYYSQFEEKLQEILFKQCKEKGYFGEHLLETEDLNIKWHELAPEYMVSAVPEVASYPRVAVAWAAYLGMGMAAVWDTDWDEYKDKKDLYNVFVTPRGFDYMDEYVVEHFYGMALDSEEYKSLVSFYQDLADIAITMIRKEGFEPQSVDAFQIFARTVKTFYKIGVSVGLKLLG